MASVEYFNPHSFNVSIPLPNGGNIILREARKKEPQNAVPESMVDEFGEGWFDRFTGKDYLHKRRRGFQPNQVPAPVVPGTKTAAQTAQTKAANEVAAKKKPAAAPKLTIEELAAMNHAGLRKALSEQGIETDPRAEESKLREQLADVMGLGSIPSFV